MGFQGDGERYNIFQYKNEVKASFLIDFNTKKEEKIEQNILNELKKLGVPEEKMPDFQKDYLWKHIIDPKDNRNYIYLIYEVSTHRLYTYEEFF